MVTMVRNPVAHRSTVDMHAIHAGLTDMMNVQTDGDDPVRVVSAKARSPGSLGRCIPSTRSTDWMIGSISIRVIIHPLNAVFSVFVFKTGQIKISGGSAGFQGIDDRDPTAYMHWVECSIIRPILSVPVLSTFLGRLDHWELCLLNGTAMLDCDHVEGTIDLNTYKRLCSDMSTRVCDGKHATIFTDIRLPVILSTSNIHKVRHTGRICSVTLRSNKRRGSVRFDHTRSVQFLGFRDISAMGQVMNELVQLLQDCRPHDNYHIVSTPPPRKPTSRSVFAKTLSTLSPLRRQGETGCVPCPMNRTADDKTVVVAAEGRLDCGVL